MKDADIQSVLHPRLVLRAVDDAITFYRAALDAELVERYVNSEGVVVHCAIRIGSSIVHLVEEVEAWTLLGPRSVGGSPVLLHLTMPDPDAAANRMVARGGEILIPIKDRPYGKREGRVRDPFGHLWVLSRPTEALSPDEIQNRLSRM